MSGDRKLQTGAGWSSLPKTIVQLPRKPAQSLLWLAAAGGILTLSAIASTWMLDHHPTLLGALMPQRQAACQTIATDPNPPLNVRSSPVSAPDNIVGKVANGTILTVTDRQQGWLRVAQPFDGWVYEELTVTSCASPGSQNSANPAAVSPLEVLDRATALYHLGNLAGAIALAQTLPPSDPSYSTAQAAIAHWQNDWQIAETEFYAAQRAAETGKWQEILTQVASFPDNRYWRGRFAPLVKQAAQKVAAQ